jgi:histone H3/H4
VLLQTGHLIILILYLKNKYYSNTYYFTGDELVKDFPLLTIEKLIKDAAKPTGADRVAASATKEMKNILLEISNKIAVDAIAAAKHAGRVTVKGKDIALVTRK